MLKPRAPFGYGPSGWAKDAFFRRILKFDKAICITVEITDRKVASEIIQIIFLSYSIGTPHLWMKRT